MQKLRLFSVGSYCALSHLFNVTIRYRKESTTSVAGKQLNFVFYSIDNLPSFASRSFRNHSNFLVILYYISYSIRTPFRCILVVLIKVAYSNFCVVKAITFRSA